MHHGEQLVISLQQEQVRPDLGPLLPRPQTPLLIHLGLQTRSAQRGLPEVLLSKRKQEAGGAGQLGEPGGGGLLLANAFASRLIDTP